MFWHVSATVSCRAKGDQLHLVCYQYSGTYASLSCHAITDQLRPVAPPFTSVLLCVCPQTQNVPLLLVMLPPFNNRFATMSCRGLADQMHPKALSFH